MLPIITKLEAALLAIGWRFPLIRTLTSRKPVVLLYHGIPQVGDGTIVDGKMFEQHVMYLQKHFELIHPSRLGDSRRPFDKIRILLTFDDGFRNHADVVAPILRRYQVPAIFFTCSRHATPGSYLWFSYLQALEKHFREKGFYFREKFIDMSEGQRQLSIKRLSKFILSLTPHPFATYEAIEKELPRLEEFVSRVDLANCYEGMTDEQVNELADEPLFTIGVHTVDHPFLTMCEMGEASRQIAENKSWIERTTGRSCVTIAYPSGDYNVELVKKCHDIGFKNGYAVIPVVNFNKHYELPRIGIYSTSLHILGFKVQWGNYIRTLRIGVG